MYCLKLDMFGERFLYSLVNESISLFFFGNYKWQLFTPGMGRATGERKKCAKANMD